MIIYEEVLREFQKQKVKYILVGGIAVNLHGYMRNTADLDILVKMTDKNLAKVVGILNRRGYHVKQPIDPMSIADKNTREDWIKNKHMKAFNFYKEDGLKEVDIIIESAISYESARKNVKYIRIDDMALPVIGIRDFISMKKKSGRDLDKLDADVLKRIERLKKKR
jgi:predicted nucleotidyltransferase